jgi:hypothetical protein
VAYHDRPVTSRRRLNPVAAFSGKDRSGSRLIENYLNAARGQNGEVDSSIRGRPVFVVGINNLSNGPLDFRIAEVEANQRVGASEYPMQVVTFEMLQQEEKNRQVASALLVGVAGAANAYSASRAGYGSYTTPNGRSGTFYSPTANVIAQNNAAAQNEAMFAATVERGQQNMAQLEQSVIKDNTLMPGEWYGGQLHLAPPTDQSGGQKVYSIIIKVGSDRHVIEVAQGPAGT